MQKTYLYDTLGAKFEKHPVVVEIEEIEDAFEVIGKPVNLKKLVTPEKGTKAHETGLFVTPDLPEKLEEALDIIGWLSVNEKIEGHFGNVTGSTELTKVVVDNDLSTGEVIKILNKSEYSDEDNTDMITKVKHTVEMFAPGVNDPLAVVAYDLLRKSLGWKAEKLLNRHDDFTKATATWDSGGVDFTVSEDSPWSELDFGSIANGIQLKSMQRVTSQSLHTADNEHPHLSYAWTKDGINVSDMEERRSSDEQAKAVAEDAGTTQTIVKKSLQSGTLSDHPNPARVIAWE